MNKTSLIVLATAVTTLFAAPVVLQAQEACPPGTSEINIVIPGVGSKRACMPDEAVERLAETAPSHGGGGVVDVSDCPCDFSPAFVDTLDWDLPNAACVDAAEEPRDILFILSDFVSGLGDNQLAVSGGTFPKGNRCTATVTIGGTFFPNFQAHGDMTNGQVSACIVDLSDAADFLGVPNACN